MASVNRSIFVYTHEYPIGKCLLLMYKPHFSISSPRVINTTSRRLQNETYKCRSHSVLFLCSSKQTRDKMWSNQKPLPNATHRPGMAITPNTETAANPLSRTPPNCNTEAFLKSGQCNGNYVLSALICINNMQLL